MIDTVTADEMLTLVRVPDTERDEMQRALDAAWAVLRLKGGPIDNTQVRILAAYYYDHRGVIAINGLVNLFPISDPLPGLDAPEPKSWFDSFFCGAVFVGLMWLVSLR